MLSSVRNGARRGRIRVVHLSDLHLLADTRGRGLIDTGLHRALPRLELERLGKRRRYQHARAILERTALEVDALSPDLVLVSGDLTALALEEEFHAAHDVLRDLSANRRPVIVVPGNSDRYAPGGPTSRMFEEHFVDLVRSDLPQYADASGYPFVKLVGNDVAVVGLDSTRVPSGIGYLFGRLGDDQLDRLNAVLGDAKLVGRAIAVMVHHAPVDAQGRRNPFSGGLLDGARLLEITAGRCASVFCGHVHGRYRVNAAPQRPEVICGGSATQTGVEGYWVVDIEDRRVVSAEEFVPDWAESDEDRRVA